MATISLGEQPSTSYIIYYCDVSVNSTITINFNQMSRPTWNLCHRVKWRAKIFDISHGTTIVWMFLFCLMSVEILYSVFLIFFTNHYSIPTSTSWLSPRYRKKRKKNGSTESAMVFRLWFNSNNVVFVCVSVLLWEMVLIKYVENTCVSSWGWMMCIFCVVRKGNGSQPTPSFSS